MELRRSSTAREVRDKDTCAVAWMRDNGVGQGLAEYAVTLALIVLGAVLAVLVLGGTVSTVLSHIGATV
ncbi:MAG: Flp family type IVb pilin [Candidatus Limnocylindrales bacterium]